MQCTYMHMYMHAYIQYRHSTPAPVDRTFPSALVVQTPMNNMDNKQKA